MIKKRGKKLVILWSKKKNREYPLFDMRNEWMYENV